MRFTRQHQTRGRTHTRAIALFNFDALGDDELEFRKDETLTITDGPSVNESPWWNARLNYRTGLVPSNYIRVMEAFPLPRSGTYLVWPLTPDYTTLCLSVKHNQHVDHVRIVVSPSKNAPAHVSALSPFSFRLLRAGISEPSHAPRPCDDHEFASLSDLANFYRDNRLPFLSCVDAEESIFCAPEELMASLQLTDPLTYCNHPRYCSLDVYFSCAWFWFALECK